MDDSSDNNSSLSEIEEVTPLPSLIQTPDPKLLHRNTGIRSISLSPKREDQNNGYPGGWREYKSAGFNSNTELKIKKLDFASPGGFLNQNDEFRFKRYGSSRNVPATALQVEEDEDSHGKFVRKNTRARTQANQLMAPRKNFKSMGLISFGKKPKDLQAGDDASPEARINMLGMQSNRSEVSSHGTPSARLINLNENQVFSPQSDHSVIEEPPSSINKRKQFWNFKKRLTNPEAKERDTKPHIGFFATHLITKAMNRFKRLRAAELKPKQLELLEDFTVVKHQERDGEYQVYTTYTVRNFSEEESFWNQFMHTRIGRWLQKKFPKKCKKRQLFVKQKRLPLKMRIKQFFNKLKRPINPSERFRLLWDAFLMILLLIDMVVLPLQLSFSVWEDIKQFEFANDAIFFLDILLNFHTAYYLKGELVTDHKMIALNYLKTWLFIDLLSSFPYGMIDYFSDNDDDSLRVFRLFRILRLLKVLRALRFFKLNRIFRRFRGLAEFQQSAHGPIQLIKLLVIVMLLAHWLACAWHLTATFDNDNNYENTWLAEQNIADAPPGTRYVRSLYWSVTTMLTVGYGDIVPISISETWFAIFAILFGCGVFAYTLNTIGLIVKQISEKGSETRNKIDAIHSFMQKKNLSKDIQHKLKSYIEYLLEEESTQKQEQEVFLSYIPEHIRMEVLIDINSKVLTQNFIFNINFAKTFLCNLSYKMNERTLGPGEIIFKESDADDSVYFITRGRIEIFLEKNGKGLNVLTSGSHFGEIKFLSGRPRTASARSLNFAHVFYLERKSLMALLEKHPEEKESYCHIKDKINLYSDYRVLKIKCYACDREGHVVTECPDLHFQPDPYAIMKRINIMDKTFRSNYIRKPKRKFNALSDHKEIKRAAKEYCHDVVNSTPTGAYKRSISLAKSSKNFINLSFLSAEQDSSILSGASEPIRMNLRRKSSSGEKGGSYISMGENSNQNLRDLREPLFRYSPKSNAFKVVQGGFENLQQFPFVLSKPTRKPTKFDDFEFDRVKIFTKYFPHNNISNVVKKLKRFYEEKADREFEAISKPKRRYSVDDLKPDKKEETPQNPPKNSKTETLNALINFQKKDQKAKSVEFLALNSEKTEKIVTESSFISQNNSFSINSPRNTSVEPNSRASRILESKIWKIALIGPEEEQNKRDSILFEQK